MRRCPYTDETCCAFDGLDRPITTTNGETKLTIILTDGVVSFAQYEMIFDT